MDMFKASYETDFSALSYKRFAKLVIFLEPLFLLLNVHGQNIKDYLSKDITLKNESI